MSVILLQFRMLLKNISKQLVDILAYVKNLTVICAYSLAVTLKLNNSLFLVKGCHHSFLPDHQSNNRFSLGWVNFQETTKFIKGYVLVDLGDHFDIVLD